MDLKIVRAIRTNAAKNRSRIFRRYIANLPRPLSIIDLGGASDMWKRWGVTELDQLHLTLVNNHHIDKSHQEEAPFGSYIQKQTEDVLTLSPSFLRGFDLTSREAQLRLAAAIMQSGRPYFIQVPNKKSLVDPHFPHPFAPFFASFPMRLRAALLTLHSLGSGNRSPNYQEALKRMRFYTPIGATDLKDIFPEAEIEIERIFGMPISLIAIRKR